VGVGRGGVRAVARRALLVLAFVLCGTAVLTSPVRAAGWTWPVAGADASAVVRDFAPPEVRYGAGHRGVDLAGAPGAPVLAAGSGRVSFAGLLAGRGVVVVQHGELRTTYEPVTAQVALDQHVAAGDVLGTLDAGHAGCPAAACLHWGLRRGETYLDPLSLVGGGPVRLLPVLEDPPAAASSGRAAEPAAAAPEPAPAVDLRSAATPSGALALAALVAGLVLLVRPRPPHGPPTAAAVGDAPPAQDGADDLGPPAPVLDLEQQRARRTAGG
jgi:murein DD-endopeptidase MepM/ murein hydrolase activator NlpD